MERFPRAVRALFSAAETASRRTASGVRISGIYADGGSRFGQGSFADSHFGTEAFQQQKDDSCEHEYERNDLEDAALPGEHNL